MVFDPKVVWTLLARDRYGKFSSNETSENRQNFLLIDLELRLRS